jgi:hypothetical protein
MLSVHVGERRIMANSAWVPAKGAAEAGNDVLAARGACPYVRTHHNR